MRLTEVLRPRPPAPQGYRFYGGWASNFAYGPFDIPLPAPVAFAWDDDALLDVRVGTVEHWFQAAKARTEEDFWFVANSVNATRAKTVGRHVDLRDDWERVKYDVMLHGLRAKFRVPRWRRELLSTGTGLIYEDSPTDAVWGLWNRAGWDWTGQNLLGRALMEVREEVR